MRPSHTGLQLQDDLATGHSEPTMLCVPLRLPPNREQIAVAGIHDQFAVRGPPRGRCVEGIGVTAWIQAVGPLLTWLQGEGIIPHPVLGSQGHGHFGIQEVLEEVAPLAGW